MSADHLLHLVLSGGWVSWRLSCTHGDDVFHTVDMEGSGQEISSDCWVMSWAEELTAEEYVTGDWPEEISFPCPVHCVWADGLAVEYVAPGSSSSPPKGDTT